ncbi:hypothetical protein [Lysobacter auxotrophicus]|uniref:Uncharacterized protein n=1 Tax=Lysobacter auxotrophicus TaxID=2992573 RepID=A0ABM8D9L6_9GAMM|nr:hypothetical protein [Lysobacter auxotrophicus]BDU15212.1 hypothetical protein LA521A_04130 [Lysobacter auxotrophicus]
MNSRQILIAMAIILAVAIVGYMYLHSREAAPLQDPSPDATSALSIGAPSAT